MLIRLAAFFDNFIAIKGSVGTEVKKLADNEINTVKLRIKKFILAVNYIITVVICLILLTKTQIPIIERAFYGFGAIFLGMGMRRVVRAVIPLDEDNLSGK
jgi:uncharacterized membrane protein